MTQRVNQQPRQQQQQQQQQQAAASVQANQVRRRREATYEGRQSDLLVGLCGAGVSPPPAHSHPLSSTLSPPPSLPQPTADARGRSSAHGGQADKADGAGGDSLLGSEGSSLSPEFRDWCHAELLDITGSSDLSLVEFLMTLASRSEVAEYIQLYLGQSERIASFTASFLDRKYAEQQGIRYNPGRAAGGSSRESSRKSAGRMGGTVGSAGAGGGAGASGAAGSGWEKIPKTGNKKKAVKTGKTSEGSVPGTNFDALLGRGGA